MPPKSLVTGTAIVLLVLSLSFLFIPSELLAAAGAKGAAPAEPLVQLLGAALLGFAVFNWTSRREIACGNPSCTLPQANFIHFGAGTLALIKPALRAPNLPLGIALGVYALFALAYAYTLWGPKRG